MTVARNTPSPDITASVVRPYLGVNEWAMRWDFAARCNDPQQITDLYVGTLLWGAVGDALGRPAEQLSPAQVRQRFGSRGVTDYVPWHGWKSGPIGTFTDDTQLTIEVARNLLRHGGKLDPAALADQFVNWLPHGRGKGRATTAAIEGLRSGDAWWHAGTTVDSAGNGGAMRAAPVGLVHAFGPTPRRLKWDAVLSSVVTHTHPVGVAATIAMAAAVAWCVRARTAAPRQPLEVASLITSVARAIEGVEKAPVPERKPGGRNITLKERILELPELLQWADPEKVFAYTYNGAFALESVPAALYCFLRTPDEPAETIRTAVSAGYDADTVASMAGQLAGAWNGAARLRDNCQSWWAELEGREELTALGERLALQARLLAGPESFGELGPESNLGLDRAAYPLIANEALQTVDLPSPGAELIHLMEFALTTNGYAHWGKWCQHIGNMALENWQRDRSLPEGLELQRMCLFQEQRQERHTEAVDEPYVRALVEAIRVSVAQRDVSRLKVTVPGDQ